MFAVPAYAVEEYAAPRYAKPGGLGGAGAYLRHCVRGDVGNAAAFIAAHMMMRGYGAVEPVGGIGHGYAEYHARVRKLTEVAVYRGKAYRSIYRVL